MMGLPIDNPAEDTEIAQVMRHLRDAVAENAKLVAYADAMCRWDIQDEGWYETGCGHAFECTTDGVAENGFEFCPYCGGGIRVPGEEDR